jgi:hypothetical protein
MAGLFLLTLLALSNSFTTGFALDGRMLVLGDPRIREVTTNNIELIFQHTYWWPNGEAGLYRPMTTLSFLFNYAVLGNAESPIGYHVVNFILHVANVLLVFALALRLLAGRATAFRNSLFIAGLWAVHPVLTESVTNIAGRADLLAATAVLSGFLIYLKNSDWLIWLAIASTVGVFSKESAIILPGIIVLYEFCLWKQDATPHPFPWNRVRQGCLATLIPIVLMLAARMAVLAHSPSAEWPYVDNPIAGASFWVGRLTALKVLARYIALVLWPAQLSADYSYSQIPLVRGTMQDWIVWIAIGLGIAGIIFLYRKSKLAFFFACFAFVTLLLASNLLFPIGTIMAERLLYLPLVGLVATFVLLLDGVREPILYGLVGLMLVGLTTRTWMRNLDWASDRTMAEASLRTSPNSFKVHRLLAAEFLQSDPTETGVDRAIAEADKSISILSDLPDEKSVSDPWTLAANCHLAKANLLPSTTAREEYNKAVQQAERSIAIDKTSRATHEKSYGSRGGVPASAADPYRILASAYVHLGQPDPALKAAFEARAIDSKNPEAYRQLADVYVAQQRLEDAAITLAEGAFASGSEDLRAELIKLYQSTNVDQEHCAVMAGPRGPALNPSCEIVHRNLCEAAARAHRNDLRQQLSCPN